jgi:hypothetical protein
MRHREGYKYQLASDEKIQTRIKPSQPIDTHFIHLGMDGNLYIRSGYAWDGVSGGWDTLATRTPSLVHDALYQLMRMSWLPRHYKNQADAIYIFMLKERGVGWLRRRIHKRALQAFGGSNTDPKNQKKVIEAP